MIRINLADNRIFLNTLSDNSVDSVVTDPPYGISFMNKKWDYDVPSVEVWKECLRVLKPGGHMLVACGTRTQHRMVVNIEDAGFEIRDVVTWLYGSGFPKSLDVSKAIDKEMGAERSEGAREWTGGQRSSGILGENHGTQTLVKYNTPATEAAKQWEGFGTALKPACEFWTLARKPLSEGTVAKNVLKWGTGGINIDECRVEYQSETDKASATPQGIVTSKTPKDGYAKAAGLISERHEIERPELKGRFPANLLLDEEAAAALDEKSGFLSKQGSPKKKDTREESAFGGGMPSTYFGDSGGASRFFYVAKASKSDRSEGNTHPTCKPTKLMAYLCKLITPPGGTILDPFMGSGSTGVAAQREGFSFEGCELSPEYFEIAKKRIGANA